MRRLVLLLLVWVSAAGCSGEPSPEDVARRFYSLCEVAGRNGFHVVQDDIFMLLTQESRKELEECAARLGQGSVRPAECLILDSFQGEGGEFEATRTAGGRERVRLEVKSRGSTRILEMVKEGKWKIDLGATVELNGQGR